MKKRALPGAGIRIFLVFLLLFFLGKYCIPVAAEELTEEEVSGRVLFISSYSYAWETVPQQMEGIKEALGSNVVLDYKFMDTKNVDTEEGIRLFYESMQYYLQKVPAYDVVIVGDDAAFQFALEYRQELFAEIPVIFEGVNNVEQAMDAGRDSHVTGVIENLSYGDTIELAREMYPKATQVVAIVDDTLTGQGGRTEFYKYDAAFPELEFKEINASVLSQEELRKQVAALGEESILVYIMCSEDGDGNIYASEGSVGMLSASAQIPIFAIMSIGIGKGLLGGKIVSHEQMGSIAGNMAMQVLKGEDCARIALVEDSPKTYCFDEDVMKRFGIERSALPDHVDIINHEETFLERNQSVIRGVLAIVGFLLLLIGLLAVDNLRRRKMNDTVRRANEKLAYTARHDPLTQLLNRRTFMEDLQQNISRGEPFGIIMYDLDNFKRINDKYGHNEGDVVLKELAVRSQRLSDEQFTPYRLAGDEFTAIVSSGQRDVVRYYAKELQRATREPYCLKAGEEHLHSSIGMAMWPGDGSDGTELIAAADKALYYIKNHGKNGLAFYKAGM